MENLTLAFITIIATFAIGAVFHWLNTRTITLNAMTVAKEITKELRIDLDKILQTIVTDGEQTRRAIRESGEWAIKTIQESHRVVKEELRE